MAKILADKETRRLLEVDPLTCPKCQGQMRILAFIEDEEVIEKILKHLGLWGLKVRPPPKVKGEGALRNDFHQ